jgi:hypothetical protein
LAIGPLDVVCRAAPPDDVLREVDLVRRRADVELPPFELVRLDEVARPDVDRALPEEPFLFVDLFVLEPPLAELLPEDRVVCAIVLASLGFRASCAFRAGGFVPTTRWGEI